MFKAVESQPKLKGHTVLVCDVSGSMEAKVSGKSEASRMDAGFGLGVLLREICESVSIYTFSERLVQCPPRRGFALRDGMNASQQHSGTDLKSALSVLTEPRDRTIVITDEQSHDGIAPPVGKGYVINVASAKNGVGYGPWNHIDGWSESVIDYIREFERITE